MASSSCAKQSEAVSMKEPVMNYVQYPTSQESYEVVVANPMLFMSTLEKLHASLGTKFKIPIIGGKELDLHQLFVEVTSRGGIEKIIRERRWKEVTATFNFPSTATNASFMLRKYYGSLLYHYEQLYYFKSRSWSPGSSAPLRSPLLARVPAQVTVQPSLEYQAATTQQQKMNTTEMFGASAGSPVVGVIDGKFESGYLVTVMIGSEKLKGVLYQAPHNQLCQVPQHHGAPASNSGDSRVGPGGQRRRRRRRKKCEIKRRDPAHPKPNRSGYNFFFAEQHARLKPLHPGKDREISRMIGELWNNLKDPERAVYQEKAVKDKERYRIEMEDYRERLRTSRVISDAVPIQQWLPEQDIDMAEADVKTENESTTSESDSEDDNRDDDKTVEKNFDAEAWSLGGDVAMDTPYAVDDFDMSKNEENVGDGMVEKVGEANMESSAMETKKLLDNEC